LASEAMFNLGVDTTRALSLIVSSSEVTQRPWYSGRDDGEEVDMMVTEQCAITTRVAPSFTRVGHLDLFARRCFMRTTTEQHKEEHRKILEHALFREYPKFAADKDSRPLADRAIAMLEEAADRFATLISGWLRVGFCQGNFNADNCLISGRTMDYGPFGFIDRYDPMFAKWTGSGQHFAFMNQPKAGIANYLTLVSAVLPVLEDREPAKALVERAQKVILSAAQDTFRVKMGFATKDAAEADSLWTDLEPLMRRSDVDYTIFWRELATVAELGESDVGDDAKLAAPLLKALYNAPQESRMREWADWLRRWRRAVAEEQGGGGLTAAAARIRAANPKYIPREWMLKEAYDRAAKGDYEVVHSLYKCFLRPYDEQPEFEGKYYRLAPREALTRGGIARMT